MHLLGRCLRRPLLARGSGRLKRMSSSFYRDNVLTSVLHLDDSFQATEATWLLHLRLRLPWPLQSLGRHFVNLFFRLSHLLIFMSLCLSTHVIIFRLCNTFGFMYQYLPFVDADIFFSLRMSFSFFFSKSRNKLHVSSPSEELRVIMA